MISNVYILYVQFSLSKFPIFLRRQDVTSAILVIFKWKVKKNDIGLIGCYFDNEKNKQKYKNLRTVTFQMSEAAARYRTAVNQNTWSRYLELNVQR
jgi:hypothetical protein